VITVAVEGDTDIPFVSRLCEASGFRLRTPLLNARGKQGLDRYIPGFALAARGSPHLIVRDLDWDAACAGAWLRQNLPSNSGPHFSLRLVVRAVEAWFLADRAHAARCLRVELVSMPLRPDEEEDPKLTVVNLARTSAKKQVRDAVVPRAGMSRKAGAGYEGWLLEAATGWSFQNAVTNSPSLARAHRALTALCRAWKAGEQ
jgi:hypothetical protein